MKNEVGTPVVAGIIVVVVLILAGITYSMFGPKSKTSSSTADRDRAFKNDPRAAAMYKAMQEGHGGGTPPPGYDPRTRR